MLKRLGDLQGKADLNVAISGAAALRQGVTSDEVVSVGKGLNKFLADARRIQGAGGTQNLALEASAWGSLAMTTKEAREVKTTRESLFGTLSSGKAEDKQVGSGGSTAATQDVTGDTSYLNPDFLILAGKIPKEKKFTHDALTSDWIGETYFKGVISELQTKLGEKDLSVLKTLAADRADVYWYVVLALAHKLLDITSIHKKYAIHYLQYGEEMENLLKGAILKK